MTHYMTMQSHYRLSFDIKPQCRILGGLPCIFDFLPAQCALLRPWSNPKLECNVASKANDGITNVFTEKSHKYSLVFML